MRNNDMRAHSQPAILISNERSFVLMIPVGTGLSLLISLFIVEPTNVEYLVEFSLQNEKRLDFKTMLYL